MCLQCVIGNATLFANRMHLYVLTDKGVHFEKLENSTMSETEQKKENGVGYTQALTLLIMWTN